MSRCLPPQSDVAAAGGTSSGPSSRRKPRSSLSVSTTGTGEPDSATPDGSSPASFRHVPVRRYSSHTYHTFPTPPPKTPNEQPEPIFPVNAAMSGSEEGSSEDVSRQGSVLENNATPLPVRQLALLAFLSLAEQTALSSISPYLPSMIALFVEDKSDVGMYVGVVASAFALAQLGTNFIWGIMSDIVGRKPILLLGTSLLCACFVGFGFCESFVQVLLVHVAMGLLNGNAAIVPAILGELTDRSNQSLAFTWLPIVSSLGSITGPALGGLLAGVADDRNPYAGAHPYLGPNIVAAAVLAIAALALGVWFEETLQQRAGIEKLGEIGRKCLCGHGRGPKMTQSRKRRGSFWTRLGVRIRRENSSESSSDEETGLLSRTRSDVSIRADSKPTAWRQLLNRTTLLVLGTYLIFQLANISFNALYPIFAAAAEPVGRELSPREIGVSLSAAGIASIVFQVFQFPRLKTRLGNLGTYRLALLGLAASIILVPWVARRETGLAWLYSELGVVLVLRNICAVGGLSSVMLLITNSALSNDTLGTLNGVAQTLSAAGRSVGPLLSGAIFTWSTRLNENGAPVAFSIFGAVAVLGSICSLLIRGDHLESEDWVGLDDAESNEEAII